MSKKVKMTRDGRKILKKLSIRCLKYTRHVKKCQQCQQNTNKCQIDVKNSTGCQVDLKTYYKCQICLKCQENSKKCQETHTTPRNIKYILKNIKFDMIERQS